MSENTDDNKDNDKEVVKPFLIDEDEERTSETLFSAEELDFETEKNEKSENFVCETIPRAVEPTNVYLIDEKAEATSETFFNIEETDESAGVYLIDEKAEATSETLFSTDETEERAGFVDKSKEHMAGSVDDQLNKLRKRRTRLKNQKTGIEEELSRVENCLTANIHQLAHTGSLECIFKDDCSTVEIEAIALYKKGHWLQIHWGVWLVGVLGLFFFGYKVAAWTTPKAELEFDNNTFKEILDASLKKHFDEKSTAEIIEEKRPDYALSIMMGRNALKQKNYSLATSHLKKAITAQRTREALILLAQAYLHGNMVKKALDTAQKSFELNKSAQPLVLIAAAYDKKQPKNLTSTIDYLQRAYTLDPAFAVAAAQTDFKQAGNICFSAANNYFTKTKKSPLATKNLDQLQKALTYYKLASGYQYKKANRQVALVTYTMAMKYIVRKGPDKQKEADAKQAYNLLIAINKVYKKKTLQGFKHLQKMCHKKKIIIPGLKKKLKEYK